MAGRLCRIWLQGTHVDNIQRQCRQCFREASVGSFDRGGVTPMHSQRTERVTGIRAGSSKLSCSTLQVTVTPSARPEGTKVKRLVTVTVPARVPDTWVSLASQSRDESQEIRAGGRPSLEMQRATGTGSWLNVTSCASAWFWGLAGERMRRGASLLTCSHSTNTQQRSRVLGPNRWVPIPALLLISGLAWGKWFCNSVAVSSLVKWG